MEITIDDTSSKFGLTKKNLTIPAVQALLLRHGVTVTHPDSKHAVLKSRRALSINSDFQKQVKQIEKKHEQEQELEPILEEPVSEQQADELPEYSWPVLNGFIMALGAGVVATGLILLSGAPALIAALAGVTIGIAALLTHGLFHAINETKSDDQSQFMPKLRQ
ncbi:MAG: hypothetical protein ACRC0M_03835 [Legionella sp.]